MSIYKPPYLHFSMLLAYLIYLTMWMYADFAAAVAQVPLGLPSVGSILHGTGSCKPCAWFWKPQGCHNGTECGHCHLCPAGESKHRRQAKMAAWRVAPESEAEKFRHRRAPKMARNA